MIRPYFRPYPGFTAFAAVMFAILIGLGVWQLQRLQWKLGLIATVSGHMRAAPVSLDRILAMNPAAAQYHRVVLRGRFDNAKESYVFLTDSDGPAYHVLTPFRTDGGRVVMVDRGAVSKQKLAPDTRIPVNGETRLVGVWRPPDTPTWFTPAPDLANRVWYDRNLKGIAAADGVRLAAPMIVDADATPNPGGWPKGGRTVVHFRNQHLSYAITWFGLAAALLYIYFRYHVLRGRLRWS